MHSATKFLKAQVLGKEEGDSTGTQIPLISLHLNAKIKEENTSIQNVGKFT